MYKNNTIPSSHSNPTPYLKHHPVYMQTSSRRALTQTYQHLKTTFPYLTSTAARLTSHHSRVSNTVTASLPKQPNGRPGLHTIPPSPKPNMGHIQGHAKISPGQGKDPRIFKQMFFWGVIEPQECTLELERALNAISKMQNSPTPENATRRPTRNPKTQKRKRVKRKMQFLASNP